MMLSVRGAGVQAPRNLAATTNPKLKAKDNSPLSNQQPVILSAHSLPLKDIPSLLLTYCLTRARPFPLLLGSVRDTGIVIRAVALLLRFTNAASVLRDAGEVKAHLCSEM